MTVLGTRWLKLELFLISSLTNVEEMWEFLFEDVFGDLNLSEYGRGVSKPDSILLEHTSANATGPFHMGRARNPIIGDSVSRLLKYYGYEVSTEYYVNDTGRQAATVAYGIKNFKGVGKQNCKVDWKREQI